LPGTGESSRYNPGIAIPPRARHVSQKTPIGIPLFRKIREDGCVDKTPFAFPSGLESSGKARNVAGFEVGAV
jgi:hypothetical protein